MMGKLNWQIAIIYRPLSYPFKSLAHCTALSLTFRSTCGIYEQLNNPYNKVTGCLSVCLYQRISLTAEPIQFYFTRQLLIGPGMVYNYFGKVITALPIEIVPKKLKLKIGLSNSASPSTSALRGLLGRSNQYVDILSIIDRGKFVVNICCWYGHYLLFSSFIQQEGREKRVWMLVTILEYMKICCKLYIN